MLVLSRKAGEGVIIDGPARLTIIEQRGNRIVIGIDANRDVRILRDELQRIDDKDACGDAGE
ncbi:MAG: carbon storage regulator [Planctomycetales bacterium]|nr:carbon storage regulator [Planctomycetales bacterium]